MTSVSLENEKTCVDIVDYFYRLDGMLLLMNANIGKSRILYSLFFVFYSFFYIFAKLIGFF